MRESTLTPRQAEVVDLLRRGDTNKEIAAQLGISDDAVKAHLSRLYLRFGVTNRVALINALGSNGDHEVSRAASLGQLRTVAVRLHREAESGLGQHAPIDSLRQALAAVDAALDLVIELPDESKGQVIDAVRRRVDAGFAALDELQRSMRSAPRSA